MQPASQAPPPAAASAATPAAEATPKSALEFNLPKGEKFVKNPRGQRLHLRTFLPESSPSGVSPRAVLFWYPGYAAHINGPTFLDFANGMASKGIAVVAADPHGHGYSDGETVYVKKYSDLLDDAMIVLDIVTQGKEDGDLSNFGLDAELRQKMAKLPFFLGGQSLGGGIALLIGMRLRSDSTRADAATRFLGVMTNCPAIVANPPPKVVVMALKYMVAPLFPKAQVPSFMEKVSVPELVWVSEEHMRMGALDKIDQPGGLGWPGTMRLGTGSQLLDLLASLESSLSKVDFPFLVLHDPEDKIVKFDGTQQLLEAATTPGGIARGREVKRMPGLKHDLLSNATPLMLEAYVDWADVRLGGGGSAP